jgi:hypothetical protein
MAVEKAREPFVKGRMQARFLPDGRLHLHDGPIDLIIDAKGEGAAPQAAFAAAKARFCGLLDELCDELPALRAQMAPDSPKPRSAVAQRMDAAARLFCASRFITPMAAVAGSVADEILSHMARAAPLARAYVNNGGDIALHLDEGEEFTIGLVDTPARAKIFARAKIASSDSVRGVATSGRGGRSFSFGIADSVTILARTAALADAAATLVANAVDLEGHPAIARAPANAFDPQSDLGDRLVTREVGPLHEEEIASALNAGAACAEEFRADGRIVAAALHLRGATRIVGAQDFLAQDFLEKDFLDQPAC